jgi:alkylated DNA repair dioxygenase AlkB
MSSPEIVEASSVEGLIYVPDFISIAEEDSLADALDQGAWDTELKRRVQHFGFRYNYYDKRLDDSMRVGPIPEWMRFVCDRLVEGGYFADTPDQAIANEYLPGQGISAHIDCMPCFGDRIGGISLLSDCIMDFTRPDGSQKCSVVLRSRSLVVMMKDSRYGWCHAIPPRKSDIIGGVQRPRFRRISLTLRNAILADETTD